MSGEVGPRIVYLDCNGNKQGYLKSELGRPDGVGATRNLAVVELKDKIHKLEEEIAANSYVADENQDGSSEQKQKERELMHIHLPYEIKPTQLQWYETVQQLVTHMHLMLLEQLDRRFILGFILNLDELWLVLYDRSGVMVTKTPINIHKEPEKFVRIIYRPELDKTCASYEVGPDFQGVFQNGHHHIHWVIDVVENNRIVKYVTVSIISALQALEFCGHATTVYKVMKYEERFNPTETFVLKRYWQPVDPKNPEDYPSEGEIHRILDKDKTDGAKHAYTCHDIKVNGQVDSTFKFICHGLETKPYKHPMDPLRIRDLQALLLEPYTSTFVLVDCHHTNIISLCPWA
ncbi:hypothetical protein H2248_009258 [Termitomyces sp. 'cryptogamus']|nr:hypothetical protein H2248_009258 [Termitomyces sp. 'cryptogamus']